ncbi:hypothetical protein [Paraburkholderia sp. BL21I4N1]|uniref:hypothetical protein n=1 Tax=Paraburkholderia sp. BL21I4N1 TaxID=1938801 RepID=UPI000D407A89|nr:hypothetical protein [Paraburkholderia sp. BL21I4N1]PQV54571.1 hypothetical protein B0G83_101753 [Paraburkholderia sp. BL21I4N1]
MNDYSPRALGYRATGIALLLLSTAAQAAPIDVAGRGVYHFASASGCPFDLTGANPIAASDATRADCNRVALDTQDAHASIDTAGQTIRLSTDAAHESKTLIGDVLLQGSGVASNGRRVPLSVQVLLRRTGRTWSPDIYVHAPVSGKFTEVRMDPYRIVVREGSEERIVFTPEQARDLLAHPSLAARVARQLVEVRPTASSDANANDITIALGIGQVAKSVARARFSSDQPDDTDLNQVLAKGNWTVDVEALSSQIPAWAVKRELFLFGLEASRLLQDVRERGFDKHDTLSFGVANGAGFLRYNGREEPFAGAVASGRAFMQDSFIGLILAWRRDASERAAAGPAATRAAKRPGGAPA